jgi:hypothetical protein
LAPRNSEGFLLLRRAGPLWNGLPPEWRQLADDPGLRSAWLQSPWGRIASAVVPDPSRAGQILSEATAGDAFVLLGPGTATELAAVQQVKRLFEAARLRNLFTPPPPADVPPEAPDPLDSGSASLEEAAFTEVMVPLPPAMEAALQKFVETAKIPSVILGAELPTESPLPAELSAWVDKLPAQIKRGTFEFEGATFVRADVLVANLIPREAAVRARDLLAANIGDPYSATLLVRKLLGKQTTLSFGRARGFFLVTVGSPEGMPQLAGSAEESLAATPDLQRVAGFAGPGTAAIFHADALIAALAAAPPPVDEYLDAALESALEFAPTRRIQPLRESASALRSLAGELFQPRVSAATGIALREGDAWTAEVFGGSFAPRLAAENARLLLGDDPAFALLWNEHWEEGYARRLLGFGGLLAAFSSDWLDALGPDFLETGQPAAGSLLRALQAPASRLAAVDPVLWDGAVGREVALALDLSGLMPGAPLLPEAAGRAVLPRLAIAARMGEPEALSDIWSALTAPAEDNPLASWPAADSETRPDGSARHSFPLPLGGPDLGLAVVVGKDRWVLSSSPGFAETVVDAPGADGTRAIQTVTLRTASLAPFATAWAAAMEADPSLAGWLPWFIPSDPATLRAAAAALQTPRRFHYEARWESEALHRSMRLEKAR